MAVPSFKSDSPSIKVPNFLLAPSSFNKATTATGSVALTIAPNINANGQFQAPKPIPAYFNPMASAPVIPNATKIPGTANNIALVDVFLKVCKSMA